MWGPRAVQTQARAFFANFLTTADGPLSVQHGNVASDVLPTTVAKWLTIKEIIAVKYKPYRNGVVFPAVAIVPVHGRNRMLGFQLNLPTNGHYLYWRGYSFSSSSCEGWTMEKAAMDGVPLRAALEMCSKLLDFSFKKMVRPTFEPYYLDKRLHIRTAYPYKKIREIPVCRSGNIFCSPF